MDAKRKRTLHITATGREFLKDKDPFIPALLFQVKI